MQLHKFYERVVLRQVHHLRQTRTEMTCLGKMLVYTKDSYARTYGRDPGDDNLKSSEVTVPDGRRIQAYKAVYPVYLIYLYWSPVSRKGSLEKYGCPNTGPSMSRVAGLV